VDILDLFGDRPETFSGSLWLFGSTKGAVAFGKIFASAEEAEEALREFTREPLEFQELSGKDLGYAGEVCKEKRNVALVIQARDLVVREAPLPADWFPPGHPRRRSS